MRSNTFLGLTAALALFGAPILAQQGEGSGGDYVMTTAVNGGAADTADKSLQAFDVLTVNLSSPGGSCSLQPFILGGRIAPSSANYQHPFTPQIGLDPADAFIIIDTLNSPYPFNPLIPPAGNALTFNFAVPCDAIWNTPADNGVWLQSAGITPVAGPTTIFGIYELSETIKHDVVDSIYPCQWYDSCGDAIQAPGLSDADLGVTFSLDTNLATNDLDTTGLTAYSTQTTFNVVAPGSGSGFSTGTAKDFIAKFTATAGGNYTFDLCASTYDSRIWLMPVTCALPVAGIAHNDDASADVGGACVAPGHSLASRLRNICLTPGQQVLIVVDGFGSSNGLANLTITRAPFALASATPASGAAACAPTVTITGTSFIAPVAVDFSGNPGTVVSNTCSQIVVTPPALGIGTYDINVLNGDAAVGTLVGALTLGGTSITGITPATVAEGCPTPVVTINGSGFLNPVTVDFTGSPATVVTESCTQIVVTAPTLLQGAYDVTVTNSDATTATSVGAYIVTAPVTYPVTGSLGLSDDGSSVVSFNCGNTFKYYGVTYGSVTICMNGRLQFGTNGNTDWTESTSDLRTQSPSICVFWDDCFGSTAAPAAVSYSETATTFSVTYANVPRYTSGSSTGTVTLDFATGEITMSYGTVTTVGCLAGISPGNSLFPTVPAEINVSAAGTFTAAAPLNPIYEIFTGVSPDLTDLSGLTFGFTPTGGVGVGPYMFHNP